MNDTAAWEPPAGRYEVRVGATMLHHLGLGPEPTEDYYAFKYGFRPQSFDVNTTSTLTSDPTAKNKFTFIQQSPITNESLVWNGIQQTKKYQCILLYDEQTDTWTLERLDTQLMLSHNKSKNAAKAVGTPPSGLTPPQLASSLPSSAPATDTTRVNSGTADGGARGVRESAPPQPSAARGNGARAPRPSASTPSTAPSSSSATTSATVATASSSRPSTSTLTSLTKSKPQPISVLKANAPKQKPVPTPQDSIISLGTALAPKAPAVAGPLSLPRSAATTPVAPAFAPITPAPGVDDEEEEEEEEEENMESAGPSRMHPAFIHQSDDSDDEEESNINTGGGILGLGDDDPDGDVDGEGDEDAEAEAEDDFDDFLAAELRQSDTPEPAPPASALPPPRTLPQRAPPPPKQPITLSTLAGAPTRPMSLNRLAGGRSGDTDEEESSSESD